MRVSSIFGTALSLAVLVFSVTAQTSSPEDTPEHDLLIIANFPESNPFGHVINGEKNSLTFSVENQSGKNATLTGVYGSIHHAESGQLIKNLTASPYTIPLVDSVKMQIPYAFFSEFRPGDARLTVWVDYTIEGDNRRLPAYDSIVTIVEPEISFFDFKLLSTYAMVAAIIGGLSYFTYLTYIPQAKKIRTKKPVADATAPAESATMTGATYNEEWIPEHHLKKSKKNAKITSGDELSGSELSATEGKRRKGKK